MSIIRRSGVRSWLFLAVLVSTLSLPLSGQTAQSSAVAALRPIAQANRVAAQANFSQQTQLTGHIPAWVTADRQTAAAVDLSAPMRLSIVLQRDPAVQAAFEKLIAEQQDPGSPLYHQWLTPQQIGDLYGPTPSDVAAVTGWLASQGLTVLSVSPSRVSVRVSGSTASVANAFRTSFAYYNLAGSAHLSATSEPSIPTALTPVIAAIGGLTEVPVEPQSHRTTAYRPVSPGGASDPQPELNGGSGTHFLTPKDFAVIYDVNPVYNTGNTGATIGSTAQHVAIVGRSRVAASDISTYAANTGIGSYTLNTIVPTSIGGIDPGITNTADQDEATLDVDRVIGTAPGAIVDLLVSTNAGGGINAGLDYNVNTLLDPIMSVSFGSCETSKSGPGENQNNTFFQQAAAEGISVFISSDDSGVAGCEASFVNPTAGQTASINSLCSSGYVTCVGGTEFNDTANPATYWATSNGAGYLSALSYIPEGAWNEPTNSSNSSGFQAAASGGGSSLYISKPTWQAGTGVPADGQRDVPDISFSAADHDGYYACLDYALSGGHTCAAGYFVAFSGTSAAAPSMAGIAALLNTKLGAAQGNINPLLYKLAASNPSAFHDVTVATSGVTGCTAATPSMCNNSTPGPTSLTGGVAGYLVTTGYDLATGLGSLDVSNFLTAAAVPVPTFTVTPATTAITLAAGATTGNTDTIALASVDAFAGTVNLTCQVTNASGTADGGCSLAPTSSTLTSGGTGTSVLTINTTAGTSGVLNVIVTGTIGTTVVNASTIVVTVTTPTFTITPATTAISLTSGATTGNTDSITLASVNSFAGPVALTCAVTQASGTAAGTCSLAPTSATLTSGGTGTSVLTINTTAGTSGALKVTVTGASGTTIVTSSIAVTLVAATFTETPATTAIPLVAGVTTGNTDTITLASVNTFAGAVALTCSAINASGTATGTCSLAPTSVALASGGTGTSVLTINTATGTTGSLNVKVTGTSGTIVVTSPTIVVTVTAPPVPSFTLTPSSPTMTLAPGATSGNTDTIALASTGNFAGTVSLTCTITYTGSGTASLPPTCGLSSSSVTLAANGTGSSTVTIGTVAQSSNCTSSVSSPSLGRSTGILIAGLLLLVLPIRKRKAMRVLAMVFLLAGGMTLVSGCGGGSTTTKCTTVTTQPTTAGPYTVTITGTSGTTTQTTTFTLTIS